MENSTEEIIRLAKEAKADVANISVNRINDALEAMASEIEKDEETILIANAEDVKSAKGNISNVMLDRLTLTKSRICSMAEGIRNVKDLPTPLGNILSEVRRPNGLLIQKVCVPLGVVAVIYESRPNVTSDAAALALKSGNAVILRSGKEAHRSAQAIVCSMQKGLEKAGLPKTAVQLISDTSRESAAKLMTARGSIDLLIPRGGAGLIRSCVENATVPCLETGTGICHIYVDRDADFEKALKIIENAKTSRPSVCNAEEVLLVDQAIANDFLPKIKSLLCDKRSECGNIPVELRLCEKAQKIISGKPAGASDFDTEFLDYILAVKIVSGVEEAISHIAAHSTHHSEAIITENAETAERFLSAIDSAAVYHNASTRFTDGGEFGLGCEMGISTQKLHARGPMGIAELTTYKYIIRGGGQIR